MNYVKSIILQMFCDGVVKLKWTGGDLSISTYNIHEALFLLDAWKSSSYDYLEVQDGVFKGWRIK